jgi:WD40 repeat protein
MRPLGRWVLALLRGAAAAAVWMTIWAPQLVRTMEGHSGRVRTVAVSSDGCFAYSGSDDKTVKQWELPGGAVRAVARRCGGVS